MKKKIALFTFVLFYLVFFNIYSEVDEDVKKKFYDGVNLVSKKDYSNGMKLIKEAADLGYDVAQYEYVTFLSTVANMKTDKKEKDIVLSTMFSYLYWASKQGNIQCQFYTAAHFYNGDGVRKNDDEAFYWFNKASENGDENAKNILANNFKNYKIIKPTPEITLHKPTQEEAESLLRIIIGIIAYSNASKGITQFYNEYSANFKGQIIKKGINVIDGNILYSGYVGLSTSPCTEFLVIENMTFDSGNILSLSGRVVAFYYPGVIQAKYIGVVYCNGYEYLIDDLL